ncbi:MAG: protoporphyrinogen oxidase [Streptosporangiaceae bacterium]
MKTSGQAGQLSQPGGGTPAGTDGGPGDGARPHVVIVGGGIAGLAAAFFLRDAPVRVTVLEGSPRLGGKLAVSEVAGVAVDAGAEALLARRPEGTGLIGDVGLGDQLVTPGTTSSAIWTRGAMRPLPQRQFMGVPADLAPAGDLARSGVLSAEGLARAREDLDRPATPWDGDTPVAAYVGARFGAEVVDRLVDPLLGGVYAGRSEELSFAATLGPLAQAAPAHRSLAAAAASLLPAPPEPQRPGQAGAAPPERPPVFTTLAGGLGTLPAALAEASGAVIRTRATVRELARTATGWRLTVGSAAAPEEITADAVVLALPARPAGRLLAGVPGASSAAAALSGIEYASMAIVTLAYPRSRFPAAQGTHGGQAQGGQARGERARGGQVRRSGYLVPAVDGRAVKAVTFSTVKWPHLADPGRADHAGPVDLIRCSLGRIGEEGVLQRDDSELVALAVADLAEATGAQGPPLDTRVTRWGGALPQYTVGHLDRVAAIRAGVAAQPGLAICGAAFDGIGIPACVGTARSAAEHVARYLRARPGGAPTGR